MLMAMLLSGSVAIAQIPVEVFAGNRKTTIDIMFFKYFKGGNGSTSRFLFFNRNRGAVDHRMTASANLPQFGFTEAVSFNHEKLRGFAPVMVGQVFGSGFYAKAGIQYARIRNNVTLFSWMVSEIAKVPVIDVFFLGRYTPALSGKLNLFSQLELVNAFPTTERRNYSFTQRIRLGLKCKEFQTGAGLDLTASGRKDLKPAANIGIFMRYEF